MTPSHAATVRQAASHPECAGGADASDRRRNGRAVR